jgi:hypothetical protein
VVQSITWAYSDDSIGGGMSAGGGGNSSSTTGGGGSGIFERIATAGFGAIVSISQCFASKQNERNAGKEGRKES